MSKLNVPSVKIFSRYDVPRKAGITFTMPTRTQQHFKNETDINQIIARAIKVGDHTVFNPSERGQYFDSSNFSDYQSSLELISTVEEDFFGLPSRIRKEFGNDVDAYVEFMTDPRNVDKAVELGLLQGVEKPQAGPADSGSPSPAGAPKPGVSETSAATQEPAGHSSS